MINLGNYYARLDQPETAQQWFSLAVRADPWNYLTRIGMGIQSLRLKQRDQALDHVTRAVNLKPDFFQGYQVLAVIHAELGQLDEVRRFAELRDLFQHAL